MKSIESRGDKLRIATKQDAEDRDRHIEAKIIALREAARANIRAIDFASQTLRKNHASETEIEIVEARLADAMRKWETEALAAYGVDRDTFLRFPDDDDEE